MSSYYEQRMDADLQEVRSKVAKVSDLVEQQLDDAVRALFELDRDLASQVVIGDRQVNRRIKEIDDLCHAFIVRHAPSEEYLRQVSAVLRLDVALERVGDYAGAIGREVSRITEGLPEAVAPEVSSIADRARASFAEAIVAFHEGDEGRARDGLEIPESEIDAVFDGLTAIAEREERSLPDVFRYRHICNLFMRVAEQAKNIREQTLFALFGEVPERRAFRVLFVDERNDRVTPLAEAYARHRFPASGSYRSAGWKPAEAADPGVLDFLQAKGLELPDPAPKPISPPTESDARDHVVVVVGSGEELVTVPFRTTLLRWDPPRAAELDELYRDVSKRVDELMTTLAGPEAA